MQSISSVYRYVQTQDFDVMLWLKIFLTLSLSCRDTTPASSTSMPALFQKSTDSLWIDAVGTTIQTTSPTPAG